MVCDDRQDEWACYIDCWELSNPRIFRAHFSNSDLGTSRMLDTSLLFQSCASFIQISDGRTPLSKSPPKSQYDHIDQHAALIGLQALTLNLESANRESDPIKPKKKCLKPLKISTSRKTPEKHVSIR